MAFSFLQYTVSDRVATIALNRPEKRNALNGLLVAELRDAFRAAAADAAVKVVVLKGNGEAFCAGADLEYLQQLQQNTYDENLTDSWELMQLFREIYELDKVVIAQVEGHAVAGGCGLVTLCDLSYAVPSALLGYTEVKIGFIPALVAVFLVRKIGEGRSRELLLTGKLVTAEKAAADGLITGVIPAAEIATHVAKVAASLCTEASANSLKVTKKLIGTVLDLPLQDGLLHAAELNAATRGHEDCKRGITAFLNKEKLIW
ncbi:enoyl-CoA hydratase/isomerase family protein [Chitinophaga polysaccharea]|uniref:enoyl-CoA hydratase/isomerase family protein n=1 Tax=Chitinophaga TaxID=79328 RepID=UPI001455742F|nr:MULTISPECIES: enoyl-CoA hydratase-related protein [Chitinophaga]NLR60860.1 enoyl-CoA hydratase/isomerase family protein [Chitinophaga polysaccharea]NLU94766.1 enoyl-CoA hydratase/isomerase family protein [Chitinophaga sp. Ak27]